MGEEAQRRHVRPMPIVDHEHYRPAFPQPHHQPIQSVQNFEPAIAVDAVDGAAAPALAVEEDRPRGCRRAVQQPCRPDVPAVQ
jgi:hypothetical protein